MNQENIKQLLYFLIFNLEATETDFIKKAQEIGDLTEDQAGQLVKNLYTGLQGYAILDEATFESLKAKIRIATEGMMVIMTANAMKYNRIKPPKYVIEKNIADLKAELIPKQTPEQLQLRGQEQVDLYNDEINMQISQYESMMDQE